MEFMLIKRFGEISVHQGSLDVGSEKYFILATMVKFKLSDLAVHIQRNGEIIKVTDSGCLDVIRVAIQDHIDDLRVVPIRKFKNEKRGVVKA